MTTSKEICFMKGGMASSGTFEKWMH